MNLPRVIFIQLSYSDCKYYRPLVKILFICVNLYIFMSSCFTFCFIHASSKVQLCGYDCVCMCATYLHPRFWFSKRYWLPKDYAANTPNNANELFFTRTIFWNFFTSKLLRRENLGRTYTLDERYKSLSETRCWRWIYWGWLNIIFSHNVLWHMFAYDTRYFASMLIIVYYSPLFVLNDICRLSTNDIELIIIFNYALNSSSHQLLPGQSDMILSLVKYMYIRFVYLLLLINLGRQFFSLRKNSLSDQMLVYVTPMLLGVDFWCIMAFLIVCPDFYIYS